MFGYYFGLALRSLRRNIVLTALMILVIGVGIGASMTTLTIFRTMSGDPIPDRSAQLFAAQIDNYGPINPDARAIFAQCLVEAGAIGLAGGAVGVALTVLGLGVAAGLFGDGAVVLTHLSAADVFIAIVLSVSTALLAGLYPTWRASRIQPAWQLKVQ